MEKRRLDSGQMIIEYAGEEIRAVLTEKRERWYEKRGIGCYMFKIDNQTVIDATMKGSAARFINHSCDPNCYSRMVAHAPLLSGGGGSQSLSIPSVASLSRDYPACTGRKRVIATLFSGIKSESKILRYIYIRARFGGG